jgi:uncharacterized protein YkwD
MKIQKNLIPKATFFLLVASSLFMFSGCSAGGVDDSPVNPNPDKKEDPVTPPAPVDPDPEDNTTVASRVTEAQREAYLAAINAARADTQDCGSEGVFDPAPALKWDNRLDNAAYEHSNDMAQSDTFSHTGSGTATDTTAQDLHAGTGSNFRERIEHNGYVGFRGIAENIAAGYSSAEDVVEGWLASDHHCANLMNPKYTDVGMVVVEKTGSEYGSYWSQELGSQE